MKKDLRPLSSSNDSTRASEGEQRDDKRQLRQLSLEQSDEQLAAQGAPINGDEGLAAQDADVDAHAPAAAEQDAQAPGVAPQGTPLKASKRGARVKGANAKGGRAKRVGSQEDLASLAGDAVPAGPDATNAVEAQGSDGLKASADENAGLEQAQPGKAPGAQDATGGKGAAAGKAGGDKADSPKVADGTRSGGSKVPAAGNVDAEKATKAKVTDGTLSGGSKVPAAGKAGDEGNVISKDGAASALGGAGKAAPDGKAEGEGKASAGKDAEGKASAEGKDAGAPGAPEASAGAAQVEQAPGAGPAAQEGSAPTASEGGEHAQTGAGASEGAQVPGGGASAGGQASGAAAAAQQGGGGGSQGQEGPSQAGGAPGAGQAPGQSQDGGGAVLQGTQGGFVAPEIGSVVASTPETLNQHKVEHVFGTDAASQKVIFSGEIGNSELEASGEAERIPQSTIDGVGQAQATRANESLSAFLKSRAERVTRLEQERAQALASAHAHVAAEKARFKASFAAARAQSKADLKRARSAVTTNAGEARAHVDAEREGMKAAIDQEMASLKSQAAAVHASARAEVSGDQQALQAEFATLEGSCSQGLRAIGVQASEQAIQLSYAQALAYGREPLPEASFLEGSEYHLNRRNARVQASRDVGDSCQKDFTEKTNEAIAHVKQEISDGYSSLLPVYDQVLERIDVTHADLGARFDQLAEKAKADAETLASNKKADIDRTETALLGQIDAQEVSLDKKYKDAEAQGLANLSGSAQMLEDIIANGYQHAVASLNQSLEGFRQSTEGANAPGDEEMQTILANYGQTFDGAEAQARAHLQQGLTQGRQTLSSTVDNLLAGAAQVQQSITTLANTIQTDATKLKRSTVEDMAKAKQSLTEGMGQGGHSIISGYEKGTNDLVEHIRTEKSGVIQKVRDGVKEREATLSAQFKASVSSVPTTVQKEAEAAANRVPAGWMKVLHFVAKLVITVVAAIAIAALFASGVGIVGLIAGGFLIGAAAAMLTYGLDCILGGTEFTWTDLLINGLVGGVSGVIGALTAGVGGAASSALGGAVSGVLGAAGQAFVGFLGAVATNTFINSGVTFVTTALNTCLNALLKEGHTMEGIWRKSAQSMWDNLGMNILGAAAGSIGGPRSQVNSVGLPVGGQSMGVMATARATFRGMGSTMSSASNVGDLGLGSVAMVVTGTAATAGAGAQTFGGGPTKEEDLAPIEARLASIQQAPATPPQAQLSGQSPRRGTTSAEMGRPQKVSRSGP